MMKNKIIKSLIAIVLLLIQTILISTKVNAANIGETKDLERGELGYYCVQKWDGSKWIYLTYNQTFYTDTDGQKYIAYCLSPGNPGVGYVTGEKETYKVKIKELVDNDVIWRVLKNGYPNKTPEELGVETDDDAYFATMQSINAILRGYTLEQAKELYSVGQFAINGEKYEDIQRRGTKTLNALFNLIDLGLNGTETRKQFLDISVEPTSELINENKSFYSKTFKVTSSAEILNYRIDKLENLPADSYVADLKGNAKNEFKSGEEFKVMISKKGKTDTIKGKISIKAIQKNYPIYYGESEIEGFQDYALCNNSYSEVSLNTEVYAQVNKSKLTITKIDSETRSPLKGVKFQIQCTDGTINTYITNEKGEVKIANQRPGTVKIKEIKALDKYKINEEEIKVELDYNEEKSIEIKNEKQKGNIKVIKVDKDNNEIKIQGVKFELRDDKSKVIKEGITDKNGELYFKNLVVGKYKLVETKTGKEYVLNNEEINVDVVYDKTTVLKVQNEKIKVPEKTVKKTEEKSEKKTEEKPEEKVEEKPVEKEEQEKKLPKTGDNRIYVVSIGSVFLILVYGIKAIIKKLKNKKQCM